MANAVDGIEFDTTTSGNTIGGLTASPGTGAGNVISGSPTDIADFGGGSNLIEGNLIGTDITGTTTLGNTAIDVNIESSGDTIGGTTATARNVISGATTSGINIQFSTATGNVIAGNYVGTNASGTAPLVDVDHYVGIAEGSGAQSNTIGGTVAGAGNLVVVEGAATYAIVATSDNQVAGNLIDSNPTGTAVDGQSYGGITINGSNNTIGGTVAAARNILPTDGIWVQGAASHNLVEGNISGLDITGTIKLSGNSGIEVDGPDNTIGGTIAGSANVLAGLVSSGENAELLLSGGTSTGNLVEGNLIGTDITGTIAIASYRGVNIGLGATDNTIGGTTPASANVLSGSEYGLLIDGSSPANLVEGNFIGTDITGTQSLPNLNGILVASANNTIGGTTAGAANIISGNVGYGGGDPNTGWGLWLSSSGATGNLVEGNLIGVDATGEHILGNTTNAGVYLYGAVDNTIGGTTPGAANVISGNLRGLFITQSATGNVVEGNLIGTDKTGTVALGNANQGILITLATSNTIGGTAVGAGNVISGNLDGGVDDDAGSNLYEGNLIGTNAAGTAAIPNIGGGIGANNSGTTIGGTSAGAGNLISGNTGDGVGIGGSDNLVEGNRIGTDVTGELALPNSSGVDDGGYDNTIGGTAAGAGNLISGNAGVGFTTAQDGDDDLIVGNKIGTDITGTIALANQGDGLDILTDGNTIGGTTAGAANLISANTGYGIYITNGGISDCEWAIGDRQSDRHQHHRHGRPGQRH